MIRFLKPWRQYNPGERAGFDKATEAMLVERGRAAFATGEEEPARNKQQPTGPKGGKPAGTKPASDA